MLRKSQRTTGPNVDIPATTEFNQGKHAMTQATTETASRHQPAPTSSAVERIGAFAAAAQPEHLMAATRGLFKRNILDSLGCAIAALQGQPFQALRDQFGEYRARSEEHTSELQSLRHLVCRLLLEKKKKKKIIYHNKKKKKKSNT